MKLSVVASVLATCSAVLASPVHDLFRRDVVNGSSNSTGTTWNISNSTNGSNSSNVSNSSGVSSGSSTSQSDRLKVIVTGGTVSIASNSSAWPNVDVTTLFNASTYLNITELYEVSSVVKETLENDTYKGVVIVSNSKSLESLSFFSSVVLDSDKVVVVSEEATSGLWVANSTDVDSRGVLTVDSWTGLIYSGVFAPTGASTSYAPIGILSSNSVYWFFEASFPELLSVNSTIRTNYSNFTTTNSTVSPVVPIIYDGDYSSSLIQSLSSSLDGLIVVTSSLSSNFTTSTLSSSSLPIVYADGSGDITFVSSDEVPTGAIGAGYLSPIKAQLLVSIAVINNVTDSATIATLFP